MQFCDHCNPLNPGGAVGSAEEAVGSQTSANVVAMPMSAYHQIFCSPPAITFDCMIRVREQGARSSYTSSSRQRHMVQNLKRSGRRHQRQRADVELHTGSAPDRSKEPPQHTRFLIGSINWWIALLLTALATWLIIHLLCASGLLATDQKLSTFALALPPRC